MEAGRQAGGGYSTQAENSGTGKNAQNEKKQIKEISSFVKYYYVCYDLVGW